MNVLVNGSINVLIRITNGVYAQLTHGVVLVFVVDIRLALFTLQTFYFVIQVVDGTLYGIFNFTEVLAHDPFLQLANGIVVRTRKCVLTLDSVVLVPKAREDEPFVGVGHLDDVVVGASALGCNSTAVSRDPAFEVIIHKVVKLHVCRVAVIVDGTPVDNLVDL